MVTHVIPAKAGISLLLADAGKAKGFQLSLE